MLLLKKAEKRFLTSFKQKGIIVIKGLLFSVIGFLGGTLLKLFHFIFDVVLKGIVSVLVFFGLYIPFFHLVFALYLWLLTSFNPFDWSTNSQLYLLGLVLCFVCSAIISIRNLILEPAKNIFKYVNIVKYKQQGNHYVPEKPDIYRSSTNPELIVYEYSDRFELFTEHYGKLNYKRTDYKRGRKR